MTIDDFNDQDDDDADARHVEIIVAGVDHFLNQTHPTARADLVITALMLEVGHLMNFAPRGIDPAERLRTIANKIADTYTHLR